MSKENDSKNNNFLTGVLTGTTIGLVIIVITVIMLSKLNTGLYKSVKSELISVKKEYYQFKNKAYINRCVDVYVDTLSGTVKHKWKYDPFMEKDSVSE